ncbi:hypothetical protein RBSWK_05590 [Rhodopirellula baltica SWK14]|uniref:Uncharacterized protein n=1 Tax=Rhodopirellula baltica SWK14 TaxID=993516 RepID=L7CBN4_RHOBT|nr:hypothetical protein RBSWK_05590 [Rhodopirellula baltica SWK14]
MDIRAEGLYEVSSLASHLLDSGLAKKNRPSILLERLLSIRSLRDDFHQSFG